MDKYYYYYYYYYYIYIALIEFAIILTIYSIVQVFGSGFLTVLCHTNMSRSNPIQDQFLWQYTGLQATHLVQ